MLSRLQRFGLVDAGRWQARLQPFQHGLTCQLSCLSQLRPRQRAHTHDVQTVVSAPPRLAEDDSELITALANDSIASQPIAVSIEPVEHADGVDLVRYRARLPFIEQPEANETSETELLALRLPEDGRLSHDQEQQVLDVVYRSPVVLLLQSGEVSRGAVHAVLARKPNTLPLSSSPRIPSHDNAAPSKTPRLAVSPLLYLNALQDPSSPTFSSSIVASNIPRLKETLATAWPAAQRQLAVFVRQELLLACDKAALDARGLLEQTEEALNELERECEAALRAVRDSVAYVPGQKSGTEGARIPVVEGDAEVAIEALSLRAKAREGGLPWFALLWRTDDVFPAVARAAERSFLRKTERRLLFENGRLSSLRFRPSAGGSKVAEPTQSGLGALLNERVDQFLATDLLFSPVPPTEGATTLRRRVSLHSPLLLNKVLQERYDPFALDLTAPLSRRLSLLLSPGGPAEALHRRAQILLAQSVTTSAASLLGGAAGAYGELFTLPTAAGVAALGTAWAARVLQKGWEKARVKFGKEVARTVRGVEADCAVTLEAFLEKEAAGTGVLLKDGREAVQGKRQEVADFLAEVDKLRKL